MPKIIRNPVDDLIPTIHSAIKEWELSNNRVNIKNKIHESLNKAREQVLLKLLGFNNRWDNTWELDHCNGRSGNSIAGDYLKETQTAAIHAWLDEVSLPKLTKEQQAQIMSSAKKEYMSSLNKYLRSAVQRKAEKDATAIIDTALPDVSIDSYIKLLSLVNPPPDSE